MEQQDMRHDYTEQDAAIIAAISSKPCAFGDLCGSKNIQSIVTPMELGGNKPGWSFIDTRLQALRKAGRIAYVGSVWRISNPDGSVTA